jgi:hypothetical protein
MEREIFYLNTKSILAFPNTTYNTMLKIVKMDSSVYYRCIVCLNLQSVPILEENRWTRELKLQIPTGKNFITFSNELRQGKSLEGNMPLMHYERMNERKNEFKNVRKRQSIP